MTVIVAILAAIALPFFRDVQIKAYVNSAATDGRTLFHGFEEWPSLYYTSTRTPPGHPTSTW